MATKTTIDFKNKKTKIQPKSQIKNLYFPIENVEIKTSKNGNEYAVIKFWDFEIIVNIAFVHLTKEEDKYSVGIKSDWNYNVFGDEPQIFTGKELIDYYFAK